MSEVSDIFQLPESLRTRRRVVDDVVWPTASIPIDSVRIAGFLDVVTIQAGYRR